MRSAAASVACAIGERSLYNGKHAALTPAPFLPPASARCRARACTRQTWESYDAVFFNYFSFGVDAVAASAFHEFRKEYPQLFTSRLR